jgi:LSD1 subclass zinc finger protein
MSGKYLSPQAVKMIHELRKEGKRCRDIAQIVGCAPSTVSNVLHRTSDNSVVICHSCRKTISGIRGAKFCPFCGNDIRSEAVKAAEGLAHVLDRVSTYYPANLRDEAVAAINKAIDILNKEAR